MLKIIIDAGHGGTDPGGGSNSFWKEKDLALEISLYQFKRCKELGIQAELTRDKDMFLTPPYRTDLVKKSKAKYCLSNHFNAASDKKARGAEIITSITNDKVLANKMFEEMKKIIPGRRVFDRKNDKDNDYYFMHRLTGDVITFIVEYGFASNDEDVKIIKNSKLQLAESVLKAICEYEGIKYLKPGEKPKEDSMGVEQWKVDNLKYLHDNKMVDQFDGWLKKIDDNMPAWAVFSILANMHKVLTEKK